MSLHLVPPFFDSEPLDQLIIKFHQFLGVDPLDKRITLLEYVDKFSTPQQPLFEDTAGNYFHFWLAVLAIIMLFSSPKLRRDRSLVTYTLATISTFLLFCLLLKWQIWHSRLHLPFFIFFCPVIAIVLSKPLTPRITQYLTLLLLLTAIPYALMNELRPMVGSAKNIFLSDRTSLYFAARPTLKDDYLGVANLIHETKCQNIGLIQRPDSWEYPLWVLIQQNNQKKVTIRNVNVENPSKIAQDFADRIFDPCAIVNMGLKSAPQLTFKNQNYFRSPWNSKDSFEITQVFLKK